METLLKEYAELLVKKGLNVQKGQLVVVRAPIESYPFVRFVSKAAYLAGAKDVIVRYEDEHISHMHYLYADPACFSSVMDWMAQFYNETAKEGACYLSLVGDDPDLMKDVKSERMASASKSLRQKTQYYRNLLDTMKLQWCVAAVATEAWAKKVYPQREDAIICLWKDILSISRIEEGKSIENWDRHLASFEKRVKQLNEMKIHSLHYKNSHGTDLVVELPDGYIFAGGKSTLVNGVDYVPNIPTEEIFSMPKKTGVNGRLASTMPLSHNGALVEDFWFVFENGKIIDYDARVGKDVLDSIFETDEGAMYLGEVALVPFDSPISSMNTIYYETLFDENASCHFALGQSYNECIENGLDLSNDQLEKLGANQSFVHVDFMVGSSDLSIEAKTKDDRTVTIFENGRYTAMFD